MREDAWSWQVSRIIPSRHTEACELQEEFSRALSGLQWPNDEVFGIRLALEEALMNAIRHGNKSDPDKSIHVIGRASSTSFWIEIRDEGDGFCPENVPDCTMPENLDVPNGRGIALMRSYMTRVEYDAHGSRVVMERHLSGRD